MKKYVMLLWVLTISSFVYGDNNTVDAFYNVYYSSSDSQKIENAFKKLRASDAGTSEEYSIFLDGLITLLRFFDETYDNSKPDPESVAKLKKVYIAMEDYTIQVGADDVSSQFLATLADIRIQVMKFESMPEMIRMSVQSKKDYETAIKKDYKNFHAHLGLGQWYFYSPKVGGGSFKKALDNYKVAESQAQKPYQKYLVHIWRSQVHFRNKKTKEAAAELSKAYDIFPKGELTVYVKVLNEKGKTL